MWKDWSQLACQHSSFPEQCKPFGFDHGSRLVDFVSGLMHQGAWLDRNTNLEQSFAAVVETVLAVPRNDSLRKHRKHKGSAWHERSGVEVKVDG
jgi:hypothetical protein